VWVGSAASDSRAKLLARALGIRQLALGAAGVLALREDDPQSVRRAFAAQAVADAIDIVALVAGRDFPRASRVSGGTLGAGSAAVAAAYARRD
jgi:superfamily II helicase